MTTPQPHPVLYALATALAAILFLAVLDRGSTASSTIMLSRDEWLCTAAHGERRTVPHAAGGVEFVTDSVCDQWSRR